MRLLWTIELEVQEVSSKGKEVIKKLIKGENISSMRLIYQKENGMN